MNDNDVDESREPSGHDDIALHAEHDHIAGIFPDRVAATAAIDRLRTLGLGSEHLGVAGLALAGLAVPGIGVIGLGGMFAFAGASALWGGLIGGYVGATVGDEGRNTHRDLGFTPLESGEVLVVVCRHGHTDAVREVIQQHSGRIHAVDTSHIGRPDA